MKTGNKRILLQKIALVFKDLREAKGLTQDFVYRATKVHIGRIETGSKNLTITSLADMCKFYKISLHDFFKKVEAVSI